MLMLGRYKNDVRIPVPEKILEPPSGAKPPALTLELNDLERRNVADICSANLRCNVRHASGAMLHTAVRLYEKTNRVTARSKAARRDRKRARRSRPFPRAVKK
jgi:hypothetical protein